MFISITKDKKAMALLPDPSKKYSGNKWGGKYLRAPDIYWHIMEKCKDKLVPLSSVADVRRGFTTGCNEFFYLTKEDVEKWGIEDEFLKPVFRTPRDYYCIRIEKSDAWLFWCKKDESELKGTAALEYINHGRDSGFHTIASLQSHKHWYSLTGPEKPVLLWPRSYFERRMVYECPEGYVADNVFFTLSGEVPVWLKAYLNSTVVTLLIEVEGFQLNHGGIATTVNWVERIPFPHQAKEDSGLESLYQGLLNRDILLFRDELKESSRIELDNGILRLFGFSNPDAVRKDLYQAVDSYVQGRIHKSGREVTKGNDDST